MYVIRIQTVANYLACAGESLTDENDGKHVPGGGKHARHAEHEEVEDLPASPVAESTECLVEFHLVLRRRFFLCSCHRQQRCARLGWSSTLSLTPTHRTSNRARSHTGHSLVCLLHLCTKP